MALLDICGKQVRVRGRLLRVARLEADKFHFIDNPQQFETALRNCGARVDLFTFMQRVPETSPKYSYPMEWDNLAVLPITTFDHWWNQQIGFKARNKAKQAEKKGVIIREVSFGDQLVRGIAEVYNECPMRQGSRFKHYGKDFDTVYREEATFLESSIFIGAFLDERLIGFIKLVHDETCTQASTMNIVSMVSQRDKAPTNALIAHAVRSCAERGIAYLVYSNFAYGRKTNSSLSDFKERNGFTRVDLPRYYVPLTLAGSIGLRVGLHHRLIDYLPETIAVKLRAARQSWYSRKFQSATEAF